MPRTVPAVQLVTTDGVEPTMSAAPAGGLEIPMGSGLVLLVRNGDTAAKTVTLPTALVVDGLTLPAKTITVPAGKDRYIALAPKRPYRQPGNVVWVDFSAVTSVTVALLRAP